MTQDVSLDVLASEIKDCYYKSPSDPEQAVEDLLESRLRDKPLQEKIEFLSKLSAKFQHHLPPEAHVEAGLLSDLLSKVLGEKVPETALSPREIVEQLSDALNTVFDSLNQLIKGINSTLVGKIQATETIRFVIGSQLGGGEALGSLQAHVDQIKEAFSIAHQAFQEAAQTKFKEILVELDPERIEKSIEGGIKFGPLKKAEIYDIYKEKFQTLKNWLDTGLLMEATLREFEKICQKLYSQKRGLR